MYNWVQISFEAYYLTYLDLGDCRIGGYIARCQHAQLCLYCTKIMRLEQYSHVLRVARMLKFKTTSNCCCVLTFIKLTRRNVTYWINVLQDVYMNTEPSLAVGFARVAKPWLTLLWTALRCGLAVKRMTQLCTVLLRRSATNPAHHASALHLQE